MAAAPVPPEVLTPAALIELARYGDPLERSPLGRPWLLVRPERGLAPTAAVEVAGWLGSRPCPILGVATTDADPVLSAACDVIALTEQSLAGLTAAITVAPVAAMVLVQVLRATETLPIDQALTVESLAFAALQNGPEFRAWLAGRPASPLDEDPSPAVRLAREEGRLRITLYRPDRRNAISRPLRDALVEALELAAADETVTAVELSGAGRCFSVGGDLAEFGSTPDPATAHLVRTLRSPAMALARVAERLTVRVHGVCIGAGVEFAAFGRRVVAAPGSSFQLPEVAMGLIPGAGGCVSLPRRIGRQRTALLALGGRRINAATALDWGLVDALEG